MKAMPSALTARVLAACLCAAGAGAGAQETKISAAFWTDWTTREAGAFLALDLEAAKLKMPTARSQAEAAVDDAAADRFRPYLRAIRVDSSTTVGQRVDAGDMRLEDLETAMAAAVREAPALSPDLSFLSASYRLGLDALASPLVKHAKPLEHRRPLEPRATKRYTGIVVYAAEALPVHGGRGSAEPVCCVYPKIWDSAMRVVYEKNFEDPGKAKSKGLVRYVDEARLESCADLVGTDPLRVLAREVFGAVPTDLVIDQDDADKILSSDDNKRLLEEGRVVFVYRSAALKSGPAPGPRAVRTDPPITKPRPPEDPTKKKAAPKAASHGE